MSVRVSIIGQDLQVEAATPLEAIQVLRYLLEGEELYCPTCGSTEIEETPIQSVLLCEQCGQLFSVE